MNNVNITEILKNAPKGMEVKLYSPLCGDCLLVSIDDEVVVRTSDGHEYGFLPECTYFKDKGECLLFPSSEKTWEHWQSHLFAEGCFVKDVKSGGVYLYRGSMSMQDSLGCTRRNVCMDDYRFADNGEISAFLSNVYDNGCKYNAKENVIERWMSFDGNDTIRLSVSRSETSEKQIMHYELTREQFGVVKAVLDYITR